MQFSTYFFFLGGGRGERIIQLKMFGFYFVFLNCLYYSITSNNCATMLFSQFMLYSPSFVDTLKNEIPEAALELCHLKSKQFSPDIPKFRQKHEDNPFTLNCSMVPRSFLFIFHAGSRGLSSYVFRNSSYKEKTAGSTVFPDYLSVSYDYDITYVTGQKIRHKYEEKIP